VKPLCWLFAALFATSPAWAASGPATVAPNTAESTHAGASGTGASGAASAEADAVDLNTATAEELRKLPGLGAKRVQLILEMRKKKPFTRVTQLLEVRGIGRKTLERLKPHLVIRPASASAAPTAVAR
jgi:competence protein ComEA